MRALEETRAYLRRRKFYFRILLPFAALCVCAVCLASAISIRLLGGRYEEKILEAKRNALCQVALLTDQSLYNRAMRVIKDRILSDYSRDDFSRFFSSGDSLTQYEYYLCHQQARTLCYGDDFIQSVTLYRRENNYLIDSGYGLKAEPDAHALELDRIFPFSAYLAFANGSNERMLACPPEAFSDTSRPCLTFLRAVPLYSTLEGGSGFLAISFKSDAFLAQAQALYPLSGPYFLLDEAGRALLGVSGGAADFSQTRARMVSALAEDPDLSRLALNGVEYAVLSATGAASGWRSVSLIPVSSLMAESAYAKRLLLIATVALLLASLLLVYRISARVYRPLNRLRSRAAGGRFSEMDDISAIGDVLGFLEDKVDDMKEAAAQNHDVLLYKAMMDILHETRYSEDELREKLALGGASLTAPYFCLIALEFKKSVFASLRLEQREYLIQRARAFSESWFGESVLQISEGQPESRVVTLINLGDARYESVISRRKEMLDALQPDLHIRVNIFVSPLLSSLREAVPAYAGADAAFRYAYLYGHGNVFLAEEVARWESRDFVIDWAQYQKFEGMLRAGDTEGAREALETWRRSAEDGGYSARSAGAFMMQLFHITAKVGKELRLFDNPALKESVVSEFGVCDTFEESVSCVLSILSLYRAALDGRRDEGDARLSEAVMRYVRENPREELSLTSLAERFRVSPSQLSRLFKSGTGGNLSLFIINCKLEQAAKWLIETPEREISDIAGALGYLTPAYFTRLFKEKYGMTPSQYRKQMREQ